MFLVPGPGLVGPWTLLPAPKARDNVSSGFLVRVSSRMDVPGPRELAPLSTGAAALLWAPRLISEAEPSRPTKETHFSRWRAVITPG